MRTITLKNKSFTMHRLVNILFSHALVLFIAGMLVASLLFLSCIKRNNDFDPINEKQSASSCSGDTLLALTGDLSAILLRIDALATTARLKNDSLQTFDVKSKSLLESNMMIQYSNGTIFDRNQVTEAGNRLQDTTDSLKYLNLLDTLYSLQMDSSVVHNLASTFTIDSISFLSFLTGIKIRCPDFENRIIILLDSSLAVLAYDAESIRSLLASMAIMKKSIDSINLSVSDSNFAIKQVNGLINSYNDSINKIKWSTRIKNFPTITQTNEDSLKALVHQAQPGDTFIIQGAINLTGNLSMHAIRGTASDHIAIIGNPITENILSVQSGTFIDSGEYIDISNIYIKGSSQSGLKLNNRSNNITLNSCIIEGNNGFGLDISSSGLSITNCKIFNNGAGGINFVPSSPVDFSLKLSNVLIVKNLGAGLTITTPNAELKNVTISHNTSDGIHIDSPTNSYISIAKSIISFNSGIGISRGGDDSIGTVIYSSVDFFQNTQGNPPADISGIIPSIDPNFSDTLNNDYSIAPSGEFYKFEMQNNQIIGYQK
jgi:hypothetical protein